LAYWLLAFVVCARQVSRGNGEGSGFILQILAPVVAGGLTGFSRGRKAVASLWGFLVGILDFNLLVAINAAYCHPGGQKPAVEVLLFSIPSFGSIGAALGLAGALAGRSLRGDAAVSLRLNDHD
jgi:hypothetical protein